MSSVLHNISMSSDSPGIAVSRGRIRISHLMFADDCIMSFKASFQDASRMSEVLNAYEHVSGQSIN